MLATRLAGATHTFPCLCSATRCAAMLLSCFSLWLVVNFACSRPYVTCERFRRVPPVMASVAAVHRGDGGRKQQRIQAECWQAGVGDT